MKASKLDAYVDRALKSGKFSQKEIVCTKALYNYVDPGLLLIKNIDLPEKTRRRTTDTQKRKRILGRSIDERHEEISLR